MPACIVGHRQQGERAGRIENLVGDIVVRPLVAEHRDDRLMIVVPARDPDSGGLARRRIASVGGNQQRRAQVCAHPRATRPRHGRRDRPSSLCDFHSSQMLRPASARAWSAARKWRFSCIQPSGSSSSGIEVKPAGLQSVGDRDRADRAAGLGKMLGDADRFEHAHRARRDRARATVECRVFAQARDRPDRRRLPTDRSNPARDASARPTIPPPKMITSARSMAPALRSQRNDANSSLDRGVRVEAFYPRIDSGVGDGDRSCARAEA